MLFSSSRAGNSIWLKQKSSFYENIWLNLLTQNIYVIRLLQKEQVLQPASPQLCTRSSIPFYSKNQFNVVTHTHTAEHWNIHLEWDLDFTITGESDSVLGEHMLSRSTWPLSSENDMFSIKKMNRWKLPHSSWAEQICRPNYTRHHYLQCQPEFNVHNLGDGKVSYPSEKWSKFCEIDDRRVYKFATGE